MEPLTVYWSPVSFDYTSEVSEPSRVLVNKRQYKTKESKSFSLFSCPATSDLFSNIFEVKQSFDLTFKITDSLRSIELPALQNSTINLTDKFLLERIPSLENHINISYDVAWVFFCEESLTARFTAPYFPPKSPAENVLLACGQFNVGKWFRPFTLDYHVPFETDQLVFKKDDPLFYVEFLTDKPVVLQRFNYTESLESYKRLFVGSSLEKRTFASMESRYQESENSGILNLIAGEIKQNLFKKPRHF